MLATDGKLKKLVMMKSVVVIAAHCDGMAHVCHGPFWATIKLMFPIVA